MNTPVSLPEKNASVRDLILWAEAYLENSDVYFGHGTDNPLDEAAWLISHALGLPVDFSEHELAQQVSDEKIQRVIELVKQRVEKRIPAAYLLKEAWFAGHRFYVDERVLVPRSPFAELIQDHFQPWVDSNALNSVLDLCTGSGCIAIATVLELPWVRVDAADLSKDALAVAKLNVENHGLNERVRVIESNLFSNLEGKKYDLIISNPPYVDARDMAALPDEYRAEPALGLAAGHDGLDLVIPMLQQAAAYLSANGVLIVEVGNSQEALANRFPQVPFTWLEFEYGGHGVFMLNAGHLHDYHSVFMAG